MATTLLASVDQLAARLGVTLTEGTADYARAVAALEDVSVRARSVAEQAWPDPETVPDAVVTVVLFAARRVYVNPDRYLSNMAGSFQATLAQNEFTGDIFMQAELAELRKFRPKQGLWVLSTTRTDCDPGAVLAQYYTDGNGGDPICYRAVGDP